MVAPRESGRSIAGVLQDILTNVQTIIRAEVRLAQAKIRDEASKTLSSAKWLLVTAGMKRLKRINPVPRQTVDTIRENAEWVRQSIR